MINLVFRLLQADEIDVRVGQQKKNGVVLLLYKDARCDMAILDETVGPMNWTRAHSRDNANCTVSIYDAEKAMWISKEDTGTESNTEAKKGLASDSFKRACVNWGIGRELYTAPFVWVPEGKLTYKEVNGKNVLQDRFSVRLIEYADKRRISRLVIDSDKKSIPVYTYPQSKQAAQPKPSSQRPTMTTLPPTPTSVPQVASGIDRRMEAERVMAMLGMKSDKEFLNAFNGLIEGGLIERKAIASMTDDEYMDMLGIMMASMGEAAS